MNDTAEWTDQISGGQFDDKSFATTRAALLSVLILLLGIGASAWIYFGETRALARLTPPSGTGVNLGSARVDTVPLKQFDRWVFWVVVATAGGGTGCLLAMAAALLFRRCAWGKRVQAWDQEWRKMVARLESQLADSRKSEGQLQELKTGAQQLMTDLESVNSELQAELDRLKRTGKTLAQQQQALESSKTVLELHVQARTKDLQTLQRRYEHILNSAGEGICGLDSRGKTTFANPAVAKLTGWALKELVQKTERETFGRDGNASQDALAGRDSGECVFHRKDGTCFPFEFVKTPIQENGSVVGGRSGVQGYYRAQTGGRHARSKGDGTRPPECRAGAVWLCGLPRLAGAATKNPGLRRLAQNQV